MRHHSSHHRHFYVQIYEEKNMSENIYDDETFFKKYSEMSRSKDGLAGAGEWTTLQKILPDFYQKSVLDLGCGYGWHCRYAAEQGAKHVVGIDISQKMIQTAKENRMESNIIYQCKAMEDLTLSGQLFDVVMSSLAFHYVEDYEKMIQHIYEWLRPEGTLVFSTEHPVFTAYGSQDWIYNEQGEILHFPVDNYYYEGWRDATFLGEKVKKYHRTVTTYLQTLLQTGFTLTHVIEPQPPEGTLQDEMRRPMMLIVAAIKK